MRRHWLLKAFIQKTISYLPFKHNINYWFQKNITKGVHLTDDFFFDRLIHAEEHIQAFQKYKGSPAGITTLELGTGWYPIVPISLFLCGAKSVYSIDIASLTDKEKIRNTIQYFIKHKTKVSEVLPIKSDRFETMVAAMETQNLGDLLKGLHMHLKVLDARALAKHFDEGYFDFIHSNNTFEHVYTEVLVSILQNFKTVISKDGVMSHFVDMSDHFAHFDNGISIYNFLKFSDKAWNRIDNDIQPQNRLRFSDYVKMYEENAIPVSDSKVREGDVEFVKTMRLDPHFQQKKAKDIAISHCYLFSNFASV